MRTRSSKLLTDVRPLGGEAGCSALCLFGRYCPPQNAPAGGIETRFCFLPTVLTKRRSRTFFNSRVVAGDGSLTSVYRPRRPENTPEIVRQILQHLKLWEKPQRAPPPPLFSHKLDQLLASLSPEQAHQLQRSTHSIFWRCPLGPMAEHFRRSAIDALPSLSPNASLFSPQNTLASPPSWSFHGPS